MTPTAPAGTVSSSCAPQSAAQAGIVLLKRRNREAYNKEETQFNGHLVYVYLKMVPKQGRGWHIDLLTSSLSTLQNTHALVEGWSAQPMVYNTKMNRPICCRSYSEGAPQALQGRSPRRRGLPFPALNSWGRTQQNVVQQEKKWRTMEENAPNFRIITVLMALISPIFLEV